MYINKKIVLEAFFSLLLFALPLSSVDFSFESDNFGEVSSQVFVPQPKGLSISSPTTSPDSMNFWDKLNSGVLDNLCKNAKIELDKNAKLPQIAGIRGDFKRWFARYPDKTVALIDEVGLKVYTQVGQDILNIDGIGNINVSFSGSIEGKSVVVTPLGSEKVCKEIDKLIDLRRVKTVIPVTKERILKMRVGEVWKIPILTVVSFYGGLSGSPFPYLSFSIGGGVSKQRVPSVTLYRITDDILRLRIRIERVKIESFNAGMSTTYEIAPTDIGFPQAEDVISRFVKKEVAKQINKYVSLRFGYFLFKSKSNKLLIEFLINTKNEKQLEALEELLKGDLTFVKKFIEIGIKFNEFDESLDYNQGLSVIDSTSEDLSQKLQEKPSYTGAAHSHSEGSSFNINIPFIHSHKIDKNTSYERYQSADGKNVMHIYQAQKQSEGSTMNIPFIGSISKQREEEKVLGINKEDKQKVNDGVLMYQYNAGFVRGSDYSARAMLEKANGILRYIGTDGNGVTDKYTLNPEKFFPAEKEDVVDYHDIPVNNSKFYKRVMISFNLLISAEGIKQIIFSTPQRILQAYLNMMKEFDEYIVSRFRDAFIIVNDKVKIDWKKVRDYDNPVSDYDEYQNQSIYSVLSHISYVATKLIEDIFSVRREADPKKRSERLVSIASGKGKSGLSYDKFMKVIVQLVSPENMAGNIYISTDKKVKGEEDINQTYAVDSNNQLHNMMNEINTTRERFSSPSILQD